MKAGWEEMALVMVRALSALTEVEKRTKNDVANGVLTPEQGALQCKQYGYGMAKVLSIAEDVFELPSSGLTSVVDRVVREINPQ